MSEPAFVCDDAGELLLSGTALGDLLQTVVARGARFRFRARGFSMAPFIRDGDLVTVAPLGRGGPSTGDVVAFARTGERGPVVHRVIRNRGDCCLMGGDNLDSVDGWVPRTRILGRVVEVERSGRRIRRGMGPDRFVIALLAGRGFLRPLARFRRRLIGGLLGRLRDG